ncbi:family 47 glycoside hydrolase [Cryphonectria parasitica EP155]|uniref:alpha-1,2-Mannosidase n=1 Tax=Cryphonectria parasitica (strain ATCC 38755 / EP155) TaxID=660469 RepID=A0A9P4XW93_CRYP1|nr:family 47 glycoside hydrolase [Cryphonectria parasitica EP155]KAF3762163.1 family 47 glycoside hydrolase [Cryphonectria parasitica EP155]
MDGHNTSLRALLVAFWFLTWLDHILAMRPDRMAQLRQETVDMFYHGYDNYMELAFPEDELRPLTCAPLHRDAVNPNNLGLNDVLGNYSVTLVDTLSSLAILASAPPDSHNTGPNALRDFQHGVAALVEQYGDGSPGPSGQGVRARGFDLDSKIQVFETVIRGVGGLLSAHLFAVGELPIQGYNPVPSGAPNLDDPLHLPPISWPNGFRYDGQLLRLALDLANRLLPAFYTTTGMPYPRVNLRHGIPFFPNSPLYQVLGTTSPDAPDPADITETCSAGAGSLVLEFTVLSRLTGDPRFEQIAKRAFWSVWNRRSEIGLIGAGVDAENGNWIGGHSVIGAGADSFFEYALKSHILLSGHEVPNATTPKRSPADGSWLDPNELWIPLTDEQNSPEAFLDAWHHAHAAIKRHLYDDTGHPHYSNVNIMTGSLASNWIDSLGAYYPGLLTLAGELEEAMETNLLHAAMWTKYAALPERWSIKEKQVEGGLGWWPLRPEFIESTYHLYRATKDTWYLYVGEMVMRDINRQCRTECGFAGIQNVVTGELTDRMETFFLGETTKYLYLLYDDKHPLNSLDAAFVFTTEGHPLIIPKVAKNISRTTPVSPATTKEIALFYHDEDFRNVCPAPPEILPLTGSGIVSRPDLFHAARMLDLHMIPNIHADLAAEEQGPDNSEVTKTYTYFPWTLPPNVLPDNGTCGKVPDAAEYHLEFGMVGTNGVFDTIIGAHNLDRLDIDKVRVNRLAGLKLAMRIEETPEGSEELRVTRVNGFHLGRDENIVLSRALLGDISDTKFKLIRDLTSVKIHHLYEMGVADEFTTTTTTTNPHMEETLLEEEQCDDFTEGGDDMEDGYNAPDAETSPDTLATNINTLLRAFWSQVRAANPSNATRSPGKALEEINPAGHPFNVIINTTAITPTGVGAAPLPPVDMPANAKIPAFGPIPPYILPWSTIYAAGDACELLPEEGPRDHQIIVVRRGRCTFSEKLANIPAYKPSPDSLQLVIVVSEDEEDGYPVAEGEAVLSRPLLAEEQRTPAGIQRRHPIAMVMMGGGEEMYRRLATEAVRLGMTRKYGVESDGRRISNVIIDDGDTMARKYS